MHQQQLNQRRVTANSGERCTSFLVRFRPLGDTRREN
jgi:hypothetical protein